MKSRYWNLLLPDQVESRSPPEQFAVYAIAYLDSAERLCRLLARSSRKATYERGIVVLYLTAHAVELFLKGAILRKAPKERFGHNLEHIYKRYNALYRARRYRFQMPFQTDYTNMPKNQIKAAKALVRPIDQLYRYPLDKDGKPWPGLYAFEANSFLQGLIVLRTTFERLIQDYDC